MKKIVLAMTAGMFVSTASAQFEEVVVDLTGVRLQNGRNEFRSSAPNALNAGFGYSYEVDGLVQGSGIIFGTLFPNPTPIAEVLELLQPGASQYLSGAVYIPSGGHPVEFVNERFEGEVNLIGIWVTFGLTFRVGIDANGFAAFSFTDVVLEPSLFVGSVTFTTGSLTVTRGPAMSGDMNWDGVVNALDIEALLYALFDTQTYLQLFGWDPIFPGDCNRDGVFDAGDIECFLDILFS